MKKIFEWEFDVPSDEVDLDRLHREINNISTVWAIAYLGQLREKAPIVYKRYQEYKNKILKEF